MRPLQVLRGRPEDTTPPPPPPPPPPDSEWATRKVIVGLVDRKGIPNNRQIKDLSGTLINVDPSPAGLGIVKGAVLDDLAGVSWQNIEGGTTKPASKTWPAVTESFLDEADTKNLQVRCRPVLGLKAPPWAKKLVAGTEIQMHDHGTSTGGQITPFTVGYLWEDAYWNAADSLFEWLAGQLSAHVSFHELSLSHVMTYYQEPMIWQLAYAGDATHKGNPEALWQTTIDTPTFGYSYNKHLGSYQRSIDRSKTLLAGTHAKNFVFNSPFQFVQNTTPNDASNAKMGTSTAVTDTLIDRAAATNEMVLMNHSLRLWPVNSTYDKMYKKFASSGTPCAFQTINTVNKWWDSQPASTTMFSIIQKAVFEYNAISIEMAGTSSTYLSQERSGSIAMAAGQSKLQLNVEQMEYLNDGMQANWDAFLASQG